HAADDGGTDQHQGERPVPRIEDADHPFVAGEEPGAAARGRRADREEIARHVDHPREASVAWHVDAVVVPRAQGEGVEAAVAEPGCKGIDAAEQRRGGVAVPLRLEDMVAIETAALADRSVDRTGRAGGGDRSGARLEGPGEEIVEGGVAAVVRIE